MALPDSDVADATKRVDEARERLERQRELVQQLRTATSEAEALLQAMQATLETLEEELRQIEDEVVGAKSEQWLTIERHRRRSAPAEGEAGALNGPASSAASAEL